LVDRGHRGWVRVRKLKRWEPAASAVLKQQLVELRTALSEALEAIDVDIVYATWSESSRASWEHWCNLARTAPEAAHEETP
jgi:hypothetical protein